MNYSTRVTSYRTIGKLVKYLTIDKEYAFQGVVVDVENNLKEIKGIHYQSISTTEFKVFANYSIGTLMYQGGAMVNGIQMKLRIRESDPGSLKIQIKTSVRPEHYFIAAVFVFSLIVVIFSDEPKWLILYILGLWFIFHVWFRFVYRYQEFRLINKVVEQLRLTAIKLPVV